MEGTAIGEGEEGGDGDGGRGGGTEGVGEEGGDGGRGGGGGRRGEKRGGRGRGCAKSREKDVTQNKLQLACLCSLSDTAVSMLQASLPAGKAVFKAMAGVWTLRLYRS